MHAKIAANGPRSCAGYGCNIFAEWHRAGTALVAHKSVSIFLRPSSVGQDQTIQPVPEQQPMTVTTLLSAKEQALLGVGAAIAAGCQTCTTRLVEVARAAGACERGIQLAIETGILARNEATAAMARWAEHEQGQVPVLDESFRAEKRKLTALIAATATYAVNSTATLEVQIAEAQAQDWTYVQIAQALGVGRAVARTAAEKVESVAKQSGFALVEPKASCCGGQPSASRAPTQSGCGCAGGNEGP
jgi:hypothetical protein